MWVRTKRREPGRRREQTSKGKGEGVYWLELLQTVHSTFGAKAPNARPWFQMDRGADCWPLLKLAVDMNALITVRGAQDRNLETGGRLWSTLEHAPVRAKRAVHVPARPFVRRKMNINGKRTWSRSAPRKARVAKVVIRAATVGLACAVTNKRTVVVPIHAVMVRESHRSSADRLEWMLLTTHPIRTRADVLAIVHGYTLRWRIEDFHRAWKRGLCRVEDTQLRTRDAIFKWATILATVATRALRLTHLARQTPEAPATSEFSTYELQAILAQRQPKGIGDDIIPTLTLAQAVRWIADIGGYNGSWKGPPGATIIGRGLHMVLMTARALEYRAKKR
jgi:hypothetical protein